jgi:hypothetical protein
MNKTAISIARIKVLGSFPRMTKDNPNVQEQDYLNRPVFDVEYSHEHRNERLGFTEKAVKRAKSVVNLERGERTVLFRVFAKPILKDNKPSLVKFHTIVCETNEQASLRELLPIASENEASPEEMPF